MKKLKYLPLALLLSLSSCSSEVFKEQINAPCELIAIGIVFENNFESADDTIGWYGITEDMFVNNPCPAGGKKSLQISGGCVQPTAYIKLDTIPTGNYYLSLWGKVSDSTQTGVVKLRTGESYQQPGKEIFVIINKPGWNFYTTDSSLFCQADSILRVEILIGGYIPANMFIDNLQIYEEN